MRQTWMRAIAGSARRGDPVYLLSLEDLEGMLEVWVPGGVYGRSRGALSTSGPLLVEGVVELDRQQGEPVIRAERIEAL
jgi:hypothetical protein